MPASLSCSQESETGLGSSGKIWNMTNWLTAIVGAIGVLAGTWGGQWIAAARDDQRWRREANREELRWEREREKSSTEQRTQNINEWRDRRLDAGADFLAALDLLQELARRRAGILRRDESQDADLTAKIESSIRTCRQAIARLDICASSECSNTCREAYQQYLVFF